MVPLKLLANGHIHELSNAAFGKSIIDLCRKHKENRRALAFAFIVYDFDSPQMFKILNDMNYWNALNTISGRYLSIYYIHSNESTFAGDLAAVSDREQRGLYPLESRELRTILPMLKRYLELDEEVKNPSILFFQVEDTMISDYFLIQLLEEKVEEGFLELKAFVSSAVDRLKMIDPENYGNAYPIFRSLKEGVKSTKFRRVLFQNVQKFPVQLLISWVLGTIT